MIYTWLQSELESLNIQPVIITEKYTGSYISRPKSLRMKGSYHSREVHGFIIMCIWNIKITISFAAVCVIDSNTRVNLSLFLFTFVVSMFIIINQ